MQKKGEIEALTGIRFFAALHVLFFHNYYITGEALSRTPTFFINIFSYGESAVSFFFILSGFILSYVYMTPDKKISTSRDRFMLSRFSRIYPVYILALLMDLPRGISYFVSQYSLFEAIGKMSLSLAAYFSMLQSWHPRLASAWNSPAWSLSVEAFFYCTFPVLAPFLFQLKSRWRSLIFFYCMPVCIYFTFKLGLDAHFAPAEVKTFWRSFPPFRLNEFAIGIILGKIYLEKSSIVIYLERSVLINSVVFWSGFVLSIVVVSIDLKVEKEIFTSIFLVPCFLLMILSLACGDIAFTRVLRAKAFLVLGRASFTLYIIHQPVLYYFNLFNFQKGVFSFVIYLVASIGLSVLIYRFFEVPVQKWIRSK